TSASRRWTRARRASTSSARRSVSASSSPCRLRRTDPEAGMPPEARLRVLIVDDEAPARALLPGYPSARADVEIMGECGNGFEAVRTIGEGRPDVVLLDVQMPKLDGFEVLELLEDRPAVVFVTAYDEFALRAFEVHAVDYLLKPVGRERLAAA